MSLNAATRGLVLGDIYSRQNGVHRVSLIGQRRLRRYEHLDHFSNLNGITTRPEPYVHGYAPEILGLKPSDDSEWFFFSREIARSGKDFKKAWSDLAKSDLTITARLGTKAALRNLKSNLEAPASGHDNPHYFDNAAMIRALGIVAAFQGSEAELIDLITLDASHTHSEDGIWSAVSIGVMAFQIASGLNLQIAINNAIDFLPETSWSRREVKRALDLTDGVASVNERVFLLEKDFVDRIYPYPYAAPESLGLLLAHLTHNPEAELMFSASFQHRRHTDSLPALLGFFLGLIHGDAWMPISFVKETIRLDGVSIPSLKGEILL